MKRQSVKRRLWTAEEDDFLLEYAGLWPLETIAARLKPHDEWGCPPPLHLAIVPGARELRHDGARRGAGVKRPWEAAL